MPYRTNAELPEDIRRVLPEEAQTIWRETFNRVHEETGNEAMAIAIAWSEVKKKYRKNKEGTWVKLQSLDFRPIGDVLYFEGIALAPGTYTGIDGATIKYRPEFVKLLYEKMVEKPDAKVKHDGHECGFILGKKLTDRGELLVRGYVWDDDAIREITSERLLSLSMEANIAKAVDIDNDGILEAIDGELTAVAFVDSPACPRCVITEMKRVALESNSSSTTNVVNVSNSCTTNQVLYSSSCSSVQDEKNLKEGVNCMEEVKEAELAKPTKEEFFDWIEKQLKEAKVEDIDKVMKILKAAIKVPYPYPYPYPKPATGVKQEAQIDWEDAMNPYKQKYEELVRLNQEKELQSLIDRVRQLDPTFNAAVTLAGLQTFEQKKALLEKLIEAIQNIKQSVRLKVETTSNENIDRICKATFGRTYREIMGMLGGEAR